ncbi:MAG: hypothetical protein WC928_04350 [Patescibacteria group bacterium]|jgi:hypothetical protein
MFRKKKKNNKIRKDYQSKNLCNPFFRKPKKEPNKKLTFCLSFLGLVVLMAILWFFLASSVWELKELKIEGLTRFNVAELEELTFKQADNPVALIFKQSNLFLFNKDILRDKILATYNFSDLVIIKKMPRTLILKVSERPYAFIFQQGSDYFYASRDAYIIPEMPVSEEDKEKYLILENKNEINLIGEREGINISEDYLGFVFALADYLNIRQEVTVEKYIIDMEFNTIKLKFKDGPEVYFNTKNDPLEQLESLILVKNEKIKDNFNITKYIDLRYGDKIFIN